ncbi:restriction endonuclease subunit S [Leisingera aquaemixtae]|uniref:restriction endonuclease subunit S n=1 Tax=Leisingera aquaemixtae TaxID=1396826 RepID=UPI0021A5305C|nr:restriction endonuclease subunit S [Leisingera aquaemixtae]UWQ23668.1 restriction endonuclease subunit S [Leisingera aquaemixtae]
MNWPSVALGDITTKIGSGATPRGGQKAYKTEGTPLIRSMNVHDGRFVTEGLAFIDDKQADALQNVTLREGDVLLNITGASVARSCRLPAQYAGGRVNQHVAIIRPVRDEILPEYLEHLLVSPTTKGVLLRIAGGGATREAITKTAIEELKIPLPPLEEQMRIAGILDQAAELCRLRSRALDKLNTLGQAIFHEMFGSVHANPNGYARIPLGKLIKVSSGQGLTSKAMVPGDFPVYGGNGINGYHNEGPIGPGRIVIGRVGVYCGAVHVTEKQCWVTDNALLVKQLEPCSVTYLSEALKVADLNQYAGRAAQPLISGSRIYPVEILLPPEEKQIQFETALNSVASQRSAAQFAVEKAKTLFASLQHRAFRGEL